MAEFTGHAVLAALDGAVLQDRAADAGTERDHDEVVLAAAGTEAPLRPGGGVGVVVDHDRDREAAGEAVAQGFVPPVQMGCEQHLAAVRVDPAGRADADRVDVVAVGEVEHQLGDGVLDDPGALGLVRRLGADLLQDGAVGVDDARHDLGAADVDADGGHPGGGQMRAPLSGADRAQHGGAGRSSVHPVPVHAHRPTSSPCLPHCLMGVGGTPMRRLCARKSRLVPAGLGRPGPRCAGSVRLCITGGVRRIATVSDAPRTAPGPCGARW